MQALCTSAQANLVSGVLTQCTTPPSVLLLWCLPHFASRKPPGRGSRATPVSPEADAWYEVRLEAPPVSDSSGVPIRFLARYPLAFSKQAAKVHPILSKNAGSLREKQDILARCDVRGHQFFTALAICYPTDWPIVVRCEEKRDPSMWSPVSCQGAYALVWWSCFDLHRRVKNQGGCWLCICVRPGYPVFLIAGQLICIYIRTSRNLQSFKFYRSGRRSSTSHFNWLLKQPFGVKEFLPESSPRTGHHSPSCVPETCWEIYPVLLDSQPCWHRWKWAGRCGGETCRISFLYSPPVSAGSGFLSCCRLLRALPVATALGRTRKKQA